MGNLHTTDNDLTSRNFNTNSNNQNLESTKTKNIFHCKKSRKAERSRSKGKKWKEEHLRERRECSEWLARVLLLVKRRRHWSESNTGEKWGKQKKVMKTKQKREKQNKIENGRWKVIGPAFLNGDDHFFYSCEEMEGGTGIGLSRSHWVNSRFNLYANFNIFMVNFVSVRNQIHFFFLLFYPSNPA